MSSNDSRPPAVGQSTKTFFGHPIGLRTLFFTEMWERFSFYGNRALLVLYMTASHDKGGLGLPTEQSAPVYAMYTSLVYLLCVPGGWLADKFLGLRRSVLYGGITIMTGHILMTFPSPTSFFAGLVCVVVGTGLLKPCISVIVGELYDPQDVRRASGYTMFYMGINLGALVAPLITGYLAQSKEFGAWLTSHGFVAAHSWHWGFGAAAVGMFLGLVQYLWTGRNLGSAGLQPVKPKDAHEARANLRALGLGVATVVALVVGLLAFNRTAVYLDRITWASSKDGTTITGLVTSKNLSLPVNKGKPLSNGGLYGSLPSALGDSAARTIVKETIEKEISSSLLGDTLHDLNMPIKKADLQKLLPSRKITVAEMRIKDVWTGSKNGQASLTIRLLGDSSASTIQPKTFAGMESVLPKDSDSKLKAALYNKALARAANEGRLKGSAVNQHVKIGGLTVANTKNGYSLFVLAIVILFFGKLFTSGDWTPNERSRLRYIFLLFCGASIFWGIFEQAGSTLAIFADRNSNNVLFGWVFPSAWWQSVNPALILCLGSAFTWFWIKLGRHNPSYTAKFATGLLFAGLGFIWLIGGATLAKGNNLVSPMWLFGVYLLHTIGEMLLSPVGLEAMNRLSPARLMGSLMGVWFLGSSVGNLIGGSVAGYYEKLPLPLLFLGVGVSGIVMALLFYALIKPVNKMMQ